MPEIICAVVSYHQKTVTKRRNYLSTLAAPNMEYMGDVVIRVSFERETSNLLLTYYVLKLYDYVLKMLDSFLRLHLSSWQITPLLAIMQSHVQCYVD